MTNQQLPIPDFEHLVLGDVQSRIRTLDAEDLHLLLRHEQENSARLPVVEALRHRLQQVESGSRPSGGDPGAFNPLTPPAPAAGSPVTPATSGPPMNPPSQGDPTNPAQPRT